MSCSKEELLRRLRLYLSGDTTKQDIGRWAEQEYYDLLKGGYLECQKLVLYPFLKTLSRIHITGGEAEDIFPCKEDEVRNMWKVLNGDLDFEFCLETSIPVQGEKMFNNSTLLNWEYRRVLAEEYGTLSRNTNNNLADILRFVIEKSPLQNQSHETLLAIMEEHMIHLAKAILNTQFTLSNQIGGTRLYANKLIHRSAEEKFVTYLESYLGFRNFVILSSFRKGEDTVILMV